MPPAPTEASGEDTVLPPVPIALSMGVGAQKPSWHLRPSSQSLLNRHGRKHSPFAGIDTTHTSRRLARDTHIASDPKREQSATSEQGNEQAPHKHWSPIRHSEST